MGITAYESDNDAAAINTVLAAIPGTLANTVVIEMVPMGNGRVNIVVKNP